MNSFSLQLACDSGAVAAILILQMVSLSTSKLRNLPRVTQLASCPQGFARRDLLSSTCCHCQSSSVSGSYTVWKCEEKELRSALRLSVSLQAAQLPEDLQRPKRSSGRWGGGWGLELRRTSHLRCPVSNHFITMIQPCCWNACREPLVCALPVCDDV